MKTLKHCFFFYGTLMDALVFEMVIGKNHSGIRKQPAVLKDFKRVKVNGAKYPAVFSSIGEQVEGILVEGITSEYAVCLDEFEDDQYERQNVSVSLNDGKNINALVYIAGPKMLLEDKAWDLEEWVLNDRSQFLQKLGKGMKVY